MRKVWQIIEVTPVKICDPRVVNELSNERERASTYRQDIALRGSQEQFRSGTFLRDCSGRTESALSIRATSFAHELTCSIDDLFIGEAEAEDHERKDEASHDFDAPRARLPVPLLDKLDEQAEEEPGEHDERHEARDICARRGKEGLVSAPELQLAGGQSAFLDMTARAVACYSQGASVAVATLWSAIMAGTSSGVDIAAASCRQLGRLLCECQCRFCRPRPRLVVSAAGIVQT